MPARIRAGRITRKNLKMQFNALIAKMLAFLIKYVPIVDFTQGAQ